MRAMIERDYNHPSIFSWIAYNESWGLLSKANGKDATCPRRSAAWWSRAPREIARRDALVEDNSRAAAGATRDGHQLVARVPAGWAWQGRVQRIATARSPARLELREGYAQARQPMMNSEFGNVWGTREHRRRRLELGLPSCGRRFRRHPALAGWLYTEHHDVINEWNGYWRFDRSEEGDGRRRLVEG
jgi:hypothetical protein